MTNFHSSTPDMLHALNEAVLAIAEGLSLPRTLQRIADTARVLAQCKYAALGVLAEDGSQLKQFITSGIEPPIARHIHHEPRGEGLLGDIFRGGTPIRVDRIQDDPRSAGFCANHPIMTTFLGVPITNRGKRIGNLYLCDRLDGKPFNGEDELLLTLLAGHAAIAIENAQLHNELQAAALRNERDRIGMELHDGVIQSIYAVGMKTEIIQSKLELTPQTTQQFALIQQDLNHIIDDIRAYIRNLITAHEEQSTLKTYIDNIILHFQQFSGVKVTLEIAEDLPMLTDFQRHNMLQIMREALANVARHAEAKHAKILVQTNARTVLFSIADDGKGFNPAETEARPSGSFGLTNIRQRVHRLNGELEIESSPQIGTTIWVKIPLQPV